MASHIASPTRRPPNKPVVFVLPGLLGSNLKADGKRIWLSVRLVNGLHRLAYQAGDPGVQPDGLIGLVYDELIDFLAASHEVIPFDLDWRAPLEQAGERLALAMAAALDTGNRPVRVLAHSSGALVARCVQLQRPEVWDRFMQRPGARALMLGPMHRGSWAPMQMLAGDDTFGNALAAFGSVLRESQARQVLAGFPGLLQCQAGLADAHVALAGPQHWQALAQLGRPAGSQPKWGLPNAQTLEQAVTLWQRLERQRLHVLPAFADRMPTVLGRAAVTTAGYEMSDEGLRYLDAPGDGRVTEDSARLAGAPTWQSKVEHGSLPSDSSLFKAYLDLLEQGLTTRLPALPGPAAGAQAAAVALPAKPPAAAEPTRPLNELKLILVGRGGAGKTSVAQRLMHNVFNPGQPETEGIELSVWQTKLNGRSLRLNVWDFAGQAITHSAHHFFMSAGSVYLLVASEGRSDPARADVPYWLRLIQAFATTDGLTSPVIVVLNKAQTRPMRLDRLALQQRYPFICAFVETECENGFGFDELCQALADAAARLPLVQREFSLAWWRIRERLERAQQQSSHLDFAAFQALCAAEGVVQEAQQRQFAEVFHALGVVVYYGADQRLRDAAVLNPQWVTRSVFKLLRTAVSDDGQALMSLDDVARVLDTDPSAMQRYIVDLMRRFDLAVPLDDEGRQWLVPQCLWAEQPPLGPEWDAADATRLRYSYAVLPAGLLPRFIARTYLLGGSALPRWAEGVVLALRGASALVRLDVEGRPQIDVTVLGPAADRLELQGVVLADFNTIHADIPNLGQVLLLGVRGQPQTFVPVQTLLADERQHRASAAQSAAGTVTLDATHELNRLNEPAARDGSTRRAQVFISYAHKDARLKDELLDILKPLRDTNGLIDDWHDGLILPGERWNDEIGRALQQSDIVLMLVSSDFIASDYIQQVEIRRAIERAERGQCTVVPIMLWLTDLEGQSIEHFEAIPFKGKQPIGKYRPRSDAWYQVSRDLRRLLAARQTKS